MGKVYALFFVKKPPTHSLFMRIPHGFYLCNRSMLLHTPNLTGALSSSIHIPKDQ